MNAFVFLASVVAIVGVGRWALRQIARGVEVRGVAVSEWQDCDRQPRNSFDEHVADALALHEALDDEPREVVDDFRQWTAEVETDRRIRRGLKRMEKRS